MIKFFKRMSNREILNLKKKRKSRKYYQVASSNYRELYAISKLASFVDKLKRN